MKNSNEFFEIVARHEVYLDEVSNKAKSIHRNILNKKDVDTYVYDEDNFLVIGFRNKRSASSSS